MNIPPSNHPCWARAAAKGTAAFQTKQYSLQMLLKRMDKSPISTAAKATELFKYFTKYHLIVQSELSQLQKL